MTVNECMRANDPAQMPGQMRKITFCHCLRNLGAVLLLCEGLVGWHSGKRKNELDFRDRQVSTGNVKFTYVDLSSREIGTISKEDFWKE